MNLLTEPLSAEDVYKKIVDRHLYAFGAADPSADEYFSVDAQPMIYLDHNATTPVAPEVLKAMMPYFTSEWGNPSSSYKFGSKLKSVAEVAREQVGKLIGAQPREIIFTSCATESNNAAIHAALKANPEKRHIITAMVEHSSVLNYSKALESDGYKVTYLAVDRDGLLKLRAF